jgi:CelD/BcsL family acetyltransferase involved in cellulose biosynthesis
MLEKPFDPWDPMIKTCIERSAPPASAVIQSDSVANAVIAEQILRTEIVTEPARFDALRVQWLQLWKRSEGYIFQHHDWITGWLAGIQGRRGIKLQIALVWDGDRLCAAMPCAVHRRSGVRVLTWAAQLFSDYCDFLLDPNDQIGRVMPLLWSSLRQFGGFDLISLQQVRSDARCQPYLGQLARGSSGVHPADRTERCLRVDNLWPDGEAFFRSLNKKARNNHTRGKRILAELGGDVQFRVVEPPDSASSLIVDDIIRLKQAWLRANDPNSSLLGADGIVLRTLLDHAWKSGLAKIFVLECGGNIVAGSVNFIYAGRMEAYFTAYDAAFERASPGTILIVEYLRWSFDRRFTLVDFLRGEEAFKFRMANAETVLSSFSGARTLVGQIAVYSHRWLSRRRQRQDVAESSVPSEELQPVG